MSYTLNQLAAAVATTNEAERLKTISRRIEHWHTSGLFAKANLDLGPKHLGRGRVRRYPAEAIRWCRIWNALADIGVGTIPMATAVLRLYGSPYRRGGKDKEALDAAFRGEGPDLFLIANEIGERSMLIQHSPIDMAEYRGGWFINLTSVFKQ